MNMIKKQQGKFPLIPNKQKSKKTQFVQSSIITKPKKSTLEKKKIIKQNSNSKIQKKTDQSNTSNSKLLLTESEIENKSNIINTTTTNVNNESADINSVPPSSGRNQSKPLLMKSEKNCKFNLDEFPSSGVKRQREKSVREKRHLMHNFYPNNLNNINNNSNMNKDNIPSGVVHKGIHHGLNTASTSKITNKITLITSNANNEKGKNTVNIISTKTPKHSDENGEYFDYADEKPIELSKDEKEVFGNREMKGYSKIRLLGKGGCGVVWLGISKSTKEECAIKQISKKSTTNGFSFAGNNTYIAKNEIDILKTLNDDEKCPYIVEIYDSYEDSNDIWFSFEKGGKCLSTLSFKIKGEFFKNERIYSIKKGRFLHCLFSHVDQFKILVKRLLIGIDFINSKGIVHADIKPENILIDYIDETEDQKENTANDDNKPKSKFEITKVKIIDFGSAFFSDNPSAISSNTPEYLCPEITEILEGKTKNKKAFLEKLPNYTSCVDIWSLGVTLLELVLACPVWMSYKAKVVINGKSIFKTGLFGFKGRDGNKINHKQTEVCSNLHKLLNQSLLYNFTQSDRENFEDLLGKMLSNSYKTRITPMAALSHPFLNNVP